VSILVALVDCIADKVNSCFLKSFSSVLVFAFYRSSSYIKATVEAVREHRVSGFAFIVMMSMSVCN